MNMRLWFLLLLTLHTETLAESPCSYRQYWKSGTCIPCTNCQSQGLEILSPCSSDHDELCRIPPVYGRAQIYSPQDSSEGATPGPTHRVRQKVLSSGGYVRGGSIEKLRDAYFFRRDEGGLVVDGRIKYEEEEPGRMDNLHSDLEAIEQELLREKARENEIPNVFKILSTTTSSPVKESRKKLNKELRRRRKKKNRKNEKASTLPTTVASSTTTTSTVSTTTSTTSPSTTTSDYVQVQVFGRIIPESPYKAKSLEEPDVIKQILLKEERNYSSKSGGESSLRPSKEVFGVSTKTWTIIASLIGAVTFIVICILVGLRKVHSIQAFKLLDNRSSSNVGFQGAACPRPSRDTYVQDLVSSRTSSFHRSTESRLTATSTVPTSPINSSPSSPKNKHSSEPQASSPVQSPTLTYVDSNGKTSIRRDVPSSSSPRRSLLLGKAGGNSFTSARELPV